MAAAKYTNSELFSAANKLRREGFSMKEAFAKAKEILSNQEVQNASSVHDELVKRLNTGRVKFSFENTRGVMITTTGTLVADYIPGNRKIQGRAIARAAGDVIFYDVRHGQWRSFNRNRKVSILQ